MFDITTKFVLGYDILVSFFDCIQFACTNICIYGTFLLTGCLTYICNRVVIDRWRMCSRNIQETILGN